MRDKKVQFIVEAAAIAAIYVVLTVVFSAISFGEVQLRFSEALTILPYFTPAAIPGLFRGMPDRKPFRRSDSSGYHLRKPGYPDRSLRNLCASETE